ncbi:MAG: ABC transporter permease [Anaerolineae bacterium]
MINMLRRFVRFMRRLLSRRQGVLALLILGVYVAAAIAAPTLSPPRDPRNPSGLQIVGRQSIAVPQPPSDKFKLGTTQEQYDVFHALVWGTRSALRLGLIVAISSMTLGTLLGAVSGYLGGWVNGLVLRVTDAFLSFPAVIAVLLFLQLFTETAPDWLVPPTPVPTLLANAGLNPIMATLIVFSWMPYTRLINANIQRLKSADYVLAARAVGARPTRILFRHLLPNALSPAIVLVARDVGGMVIVDATFAFFKLGGTVEWGQLLALNRSWILGAAGNPLTYWWVYLPFALALIIFSVACGMLGESLNAALNPRVK